MMDKHVYPTRGGSTGMSLYEHATLEILKALIANPEYIRNTPENLMAMSTKMALVYMKEMSK